MYKKLLTIFFIVLLPLQSHAWRKWEYINPAHVELSIQPIKKEIVAGEKAIFVIRAKNKSDKPITLFFKTGQQYDLAGYSENSQIFRYSQGMMWQEAPHSIELFPGKDLTHEISWQTIDRNGCPLPQGLYRVKGMLMVSPRHLVTNTTSFRLLPPKDVEPQKIKARLNQLLSIDLPRYQGQRELIWEIQYINNDNRAHIHKRTVENDKAIIVFYPKRLGQFSFHLYAYIDTKTIKQSIERRTYIVDVVSLYDE